MRKMSSFKMYFFDVFTSLIHLHIRKEGVPFAQEHARAFSFTLPRKIRLIAHLTDRNPRKPSSYVERLIVLKGLTSDGEKSKTNAN